ncbi:MAG: DUF4193 family protein [Actinomycetota bacterium]
MPTPDDLGDEEYDDLGEIDEIDELDSSVTAVDGDLDDAGDDDADDEDDGETEETDVADLDDDAGDEEEESLDVILAREQDLEEEFAGVGSTERRASPTSTPAGEDEFTCRSCFLVKRIAQLADPEEMICRDCV